MRWGLNRGFKENLSIERLLILLHDDLFREKIRDTILHVIVSDTSRRNNFVLHSIKMWLLLFAIENCKPVTRSAAPMYSRVNVKTRIVNFAAINSAIRNVSSKFIKSGHLTTERILSEIRAHHLSSDPGYLSQIDGNILNYQRDRSPRAVRSGLKVMLPVVSRWR